MKERHLFTLLSVEAAACVLFCILQRSLSGLFSTLIAFPFEQIGAGLRVLSLSGAVGNVVAIILYMLLGLIPAGIWGFLHWRKKSEPLDIMLLVISALLFVTLYYMINPGLLSTGVPGTGKWLIRLARRRSSSVRRAIAMPPLADARPLTLCASHRSGSVSCS